MLTLHNATESDFPFYLALKSEDECIKWGGFRNKPDAQKLREVFSERIFSRTNRILIGKDVSGNPICYGQITISGPRIAEISYSVSNSVAGRGFGTKLVNELVHTIRVEHLNVREIIAWIFENNFPSISVVNRNDFTACRETREGNLLGTPTTMRKFSKELERVTIIGEAGVNHNGDINIARKLIEVASTSGLDFVKFQTWMTDELVDKSAPKANYQKKNDSSSSQYQMLKKLELQFSEFCELKKYAESLGISFLSTPDDKPSLDFLTDELDLRKNRIR